MMSYIEKPEILFYQSLGELFYAIAASDKVVRASEYNTLKRMVMDDWKIYEEVKDFYDESVGYQMEFVFEWFDYEHTDAQECFENFCDYARAYPKLFNKENSNLIIKTANAIANAFAGKNKSELIMLTKLKLVLTEINKN
ncbi:hypothetical protein [uncultured Algibacter sp.]|uniref:hypothetical protein n=1 Tax=uncultured Algibacter sp. TaxID=298659 RepID=UPI0032180E4F